MRSRILKDCNGFNSLIRSFVLGKTVQRKKTSNIVSSRAERAAPARRLWHRVLSLKSPIPRRQSSNLQIHVGRNCGTVVLLNNDVVVTEGWLSQLIGLASVAPTTEMSREADLGVSTTEHTETTEIGGEGQRAGASAKLRKSSYREEREVSESRSRGVHRGDHDSCPV
jgi:hypothetical protein